jgi:hypothetical protein
VETIQIVIHRCAIIPDAGASVDPRLTDLLERIRAIHGVEAASLTTSNVPFSGRWTSRLMFIPGRRLPPRESGFGYSAVSPDYFRVLGVRLRRGRFFTPADAQGSDPVAILNETAARTYFPGQDPVGQTVQVDGRAESSASWVTSAAFAPRLPLSVRRSCRCPGTTRLGAR